MNVIKTTILLCFILNMNISYSYLYNNMKFRDFNGNYKRPNYWVPMNEDEKIGYFEYEKMVKHQKFKDLKYQYFDDRKKKKKKNIFIIEFDFEKEDYFREQHGEVPITDIY